MEIDWGPPGSTSRSFETNVPELRDPQHYNVTNSTSPLRGGTAGEAVNGTSASNNLMAGLWLLVVVLTCLLSSPQYPDARYRRGRQIREEARRRRQLRDEQQKRLQQVSDPSQRRKMVEDSLEIQRVTSSRGGVLTLEPMERKGDDDLEGGDERNGLHLQLAYGDESCGDDGEEDNDANQSSSICAICLEPFEVGHVVAWSRPKQPHLDPECSHVFHRCVCRPLHALPCLYSRRRNSSCAHELSCLSRTAGTASAPGFRMRRTMIVRRAGLSCSTTTMKESQSMTREFWYQLKKAATKMVGEMMIPPPDRCL